ncbi:unnamed protein product [Clavelina lepadiformis]|uniref:Uncharacterized protein n=1 Tax=Clavelina lepadiformis TaxID=159417 RepID=A0ABP0G3P6_CLALP
MTKMLTTPGIPRRSPIQVLTEPKVAKLPRSNEIGSTQPGMVAVIHPSTNRARGCLITEIERDRTRSNEIGSTQAARLKFLQHPVTHPSTNRARGCLTSEIERDRVYSTWYGRRRFQKK